MLNRTPELGDAAASALRGRTAALLTRSVHPGRPAATGHPSGRCRTSRPSRHLSPARTRPSPAAPDGAGDPNRPVADADRVPLQAQTRFPTQIELLLGDWDTVERCARDSTQTAQLRHRFRRGFCEVPCDQRSTRPSVVGHLASLDDAVNIQSLRPARRKPEHQPARRRPHHNRHHRHIAAPVAIGNFRHLEQPNRLLLWRLPRFHRSRWAGGAGTAPGRTDHSVFKVGAAPQCGASAVAQGATTLGDQQRLLSPAR